jgi:hypothetical protein
MELLVICILANRQYHLPSRSHELGSFFFEFTFELAFWQQTDGTVSRPDTYLVYTVPRPQT